MSQFIVQMKRINNLMILLYQKKKKIVLMLQEYRMRPVCLFELVNNITKEVDEGNICRIMSSLQGVFYIDCQYKSLK